MNKKDKNYNKIRQDRYRTLRALGFSSYECNRLKDLATEKLKAVIILRQDFNKTLERLIKEES